MILLSIFSVVLTALFYQNDPNINYNTNVNSNLPPNLLMNPNSISFPYNHNFNVNNQQKYQYNKEILGSGLYPSYSDPNINYNTNVNSNLTPNLVMIPNSTSFPYNDNFNANNQNNKEIFTSSLYPSYFFSEDWKNLSNKPQDSLKHQENKEISDPYSLNLSNQSKDSLKYQDNKEIFTSILSPSNSLDWKNVSNQSQENRSLTRKKNNNFFLNNLNIEKKLFNLYENNFKQLYSNQHKNNIQQISTDDINQPKYQLSLFLDTQFNSNNNSKVNIIESIKDKIFIDDKTIIYYVNKNHQLIFDLNTLLQNKNRFYNLLNYFIRVNKIKNINNNNVKKNLSRKDNNNQFKNEILKIQDTSYNNKTYNKLDLNNFNMMISPNITQINDDNLVSVTSINKNQNLTINITNESNPQLKNTFIEESNNDIKKSNNEIEESQTEIMQRSKNHKIKEDIKDLDKEFIEKDSNTTRYNENKNFQNNFDSSYNFFFENITIIASIISTEILHIIGYIIGLKFFFNQKIKSFFLIMLNKIGNILNMLNWNNIGNILSRLNKDNFIKVKNFLMNSFNLLNKDNLIKVKNFLMHTLKTLKKSILSTLIQKFFDNYLDLILEAFFFIIYLYKLIFS